MEYNYTILKERLNILTNQVQKINWRDYEDERCDLDELFSGIDTFFIGFIGSLLLKKQKQDNISRFFPKSEEIMKLEATLLEYEYQDKTWMNIFLHCFNVEREINTQDIRDFWELNIKRLSEEIEKERTNLDAKYYALTYLFDADVEGVLIPIGRKKEIEALGKQMGLNGNTFYKNVNTAYHSIDRNTKQNLIKEYGENWKESVLNLSKNPKRLEKYLNEKML